LDLLYATYTGVKHVWFWDGWPFDEISYHDVVLTHARPRVIFLNRRNALQRAVSHHIARQTSVWHVNGARDPNRREIASREIAPIDIDWLRSYIDGQHSRTERYREQLVASGVDWMDLAYEDLYNPALGLAARLQTLGEIVDFLGARPISREAKAMARMLDPKITKINSSSTYRRVPNIDEIERLFGGPDNGYVNDTSPTALSMPLIFVGAGVREPETNAAPMSDAERIAALEVQATYLRRIAQQQSADLRAVEQRLSSTLVRVAGRVELVVGKALARLRPSQMAPALGRRRPVENLT